MYSCRFDRAQKLIIQQDLDGWLIFNSLGSDIHSSYLLGIDTYAPHFIFVDKNGSHMVFSGVMEAPMIQKAITTQKLKVNLKIVKNFNQIGNILKNLVKNKKIALNYGENVFSSQGSGYANYLRVGEFNEIKKIAPSTEFVSAAELIMKLRSIYSEADIKILKEVVQKSIEILEQVPSWDVKEWTELELKAKIQYEILKLGKPSFETIVASGENSADPHHNSNQKRIKNGVLLIDMGININQIKSDITWTYWVGGSTPDDFLQAYSALYEAKKVANKYMVAEKPIYLPALKCREVLEQYGFDHKTLFMHSLGHPLSVGNIMRVDSPKDLHFEENMTYTNEPGLYWQGDYGIRLEDDLLIGKKGADLLSYTPKEPILI